jgi:hypothetical protein
MNLFVIGAVSITVTAAVAVLVGILIAIKSHFCTFFGFIVAVVRIFIVVVVNAIGFDLVVVGISSINSLAVFVGRIGWNG